MTLARLLAPGPPRGTATALLTFGTLALLASDVAYDAGPSTQRITTTARCSTLGWLVCFIAWGAAALHPSMAELTRPVGQRAPDASRVTLVTLMFASLIPPIFLFARSYTQRDRVDGVIAVACGVLYLLMLSRLWDVAASHRRGLIRERTLRVASAALASAGSVEEVATAVTDAASALITARPANRTALLAVRDGDYLRYVYPAGSAEPAYPPDPVGIWLRLSQGRTPRFVSTEEIRSARERTAPSAVPGGRSRC